MGDWTTYTSEKNKESISITKSVGLSNKSISEQSINDLLFFHQEFFENLFEKISNEINSHIDLEKISINLLNQRLIKENQTSDIYQCKFHINKLEQIDMLLSTKTVKYITHRLCGGNTAPESHDSLSEIEISIISSINDIFIQTLSHSWQQIFEAPENSYIAKYGDYEHDPQQADNESVIELTCNFRLFDQPGLSITVIYSLKTIEDLLSYKDMLQSNISESIHLEKETLNETKVAIKSILGSTSLALSDLQNIELGDVIFLENHKVESPIEFVVNDAISFNCLPVKINENDIAVQIINQPHYESFVKEKSKPLHGPLIETKEPIKKNQESPPPPQEETNTETDEIEHNTTEESFEETDLDSETTNAFEEEAPITSEEPTENSEDTDDFSWDDLDE